MKILALGLLVFAMVLGMAPAAFAVHSVPFTGAGIGIATITPTSVSIAGVGRYTGLGLTTIAATGSVSDVTSCPAFPATTLQDVLTGANGDSVTLKVSDASCSSTANPAVFQVTASFNIVGGTGRFAYARGSGTIEGTAALVSPTQGTWSERMTGTMFF